MFVNCAHMSYNMIPEQLIPKNAQKFLNSTVVGTLILHLLCAAMCQIVSQHRVTRILTSS